MGQGTLSAFNKASFCCMEFLETGVCVTLCACQYPGLNTTVSGNCNVYGYTPNSIRKMKRMTKI